MIGRLFGGIDGLFRGIRKAIWNIWRWFLDGPGQGIAFGLIIGVTGLIVLIGGSARRVDKAIGWAERALIVFVTLAMTFLAFNEYLIREFRPLLDTNLFGLWGLTGQMNLALFCMIIVGFVGASLATQQDGHLSVDAIDRVLTRGPARFVKRFTSVVAAGLCVLLMRASWSTLYQESDLAFEGVKVWTGMARPINWIVSLMPGEKYGPGTPFVDRFAWEDAKFELGLAFDELPRSIGYVEVGGEFPRWLAYLVLTIAFTVMALRFAGRAVSPKVDDDIQPPPPGGRRTADVLLAGLFPGALVAMGLGLWLGTGWMILVASVLLVFLGAPLFVAVGVGTLACWVLIQQKSPGNVVIDMLEATKKQELLAIPFFVLAGNLMTQGSMATRLIEFARALLGRMPGGLGVGAVLACGIFAAISGSSPVTVIAIGSVMFPMLIRGGYAENYSVGVLTTAGGLGIIIPPSIPMIVFAIMVGYVPAVADRGGVDVAELFKAGILPGVFIALMLSLYTLYANWPRPGEQASTLDASDPLLQQSYFRSVVHTFGRGFLSLMLPVLVLGGIYGLFNLNFIGIDFSIAFTVTEAAAVAVVYALFVELAIYREMPWRKVPEVFTESAIMMGSLFLIIVLAISLNLFFSWEELPEKAAAWMVANVDSKFGFLVMVNIFLLLLGCVMDILSAILIVAPLLAPIAMSYGLHPIHFGIMFIVNLELGYLTPPMGINLFVASTVFGRSLISVIRAVLPFLLVMLFCLIVIVWVPELSLLFVKD